MKTKRGRGRPKGPREARKVRVTSHFHVEPFPTDRPTADYLPELAALFRNYKLEQAKLTDPCGIFRNMLNQCAEAIESGDVARLAYYAFWAMRDNALQVYNEPMEVPDRILSRASLVEIGKDKLAADKRRGKTVSLRASLKA